MTLSLNFFPSLVIYIVYSHSYITLFLFTYFFKGFTIDDQRFWQSKRG